MKHAPITLFVYNRPDHLKRTLEYLLKNEGVNKSALYIFSEGPKVNVSDVELEKIKEVRKIISNLKGFGELNLSFADVNVGCAATMTSGIKQVLDLHERTIILEDDIITHPDFLSFCNAGLEFYEHEKSVKQIGGFMFPVKEKLPKVLLSRAIFCWGWATWKRAWDELSMDAEILMAEIKKRNLSNEFDLNGNYPYLKSLEQQKDKKIDAWDICWYASVFLNSGLGVYPGKSLTQNIGMDGSGTHFTKPATIPEISFDYENKIELEFPEVNKPDKHNENLIHNAVNSWAHGSLSNRLKSKLSEIVNRILPVSKA